MTAINLHNIPPFTVFDAKQGNWNKRKRHWKSMGIQSEIGRDGLLTYRGARSQSDFIGSKMNQHDSATSIFDPVLTEIMYNWYSAPGWKILDPFAGGSVRGIVASKLNRSYTGVELRGEQVAANKQQLNIVKDCEYQPEWIEGDSVQVVPTLPNDFDFVFSCPPYGNLEVYSDDEHDISNMEYDDFLSFYREIIHASVDKLKDNRFAAFVVADYRDKGILRPLGADTIRAFEDAGMKYYCDAILVTPLGTLPFRATKQMMASRKLGKAHQNIFIFVKGDPFVATKEMNEAGNISKFEKEEIPTLDSFF